MEQREEEAPFVRTLSNVVDTEGLQLQTANQGFGGGRYDRCKFGDDGVVVVVRGYRGVGLPEYRVEYDRIEWERTEEIDPGVFRLIEGVKASGGYEKVRVGVRIKKPREDYRGREEEAPTSWQFID